MPLQGRSSLMSNPKRIFQVTSSSPPSSTTNDYGMWSLHIPAFQTPPETTESPAPVTDGETDLHGSVSSAAAASLIFDARSLVVKREPPQPSAPLLAGDAVVHGATTLRRGSSAFGFADGRHQQGLPPAAVYHPFGPPSPRLWTTESMAAVADDYDVSAGPRMTSCGGGGSLSGSDGAGRPHTSDRSSTSPSTRVQPLDTVDAATASTSSNFLIGTSCIVTFIQYIVWFKLSWVCFR